MYGSTRAYDMRCERIVSEFLDTYFYSMYDVSTERVYRRELQLNGADVIVDGKMYIDEKLKLYPLNEFITCLAFELQFYTSGRRLVEGWFLKDDSITTHYNIVTAFLCGKKSKLESMDDIEHLNLLFVSKSALKRYVYSTISHDMLLRDMEELRARQAHEYDKGKLRKKYKHDKFWLTRSVHLAEEPINLNVPRKRLCELPNSVEFCVSMFGVQKMANSNAPIVLEMDMDGTLKSANDVVFA